MSQNFNFLLLFYNNLLDEADLPVEPILLTSTLQMRRYAGDVGKVFCIYRIKKRFFVFVPVH